MPSCELCGRRMKGKGRNVEIEGAMMNICPQCASKFGKSSSDGGTGRDTSNPRTRPSWTSRPKTSPPRPSVRRSTTPVKIKKKPKPRPSRSGPLLDELELVENYATMIREARQKKKMNQEQLAQKIGERITTLQSIEAGRLKPTRKAIRGLERELGISLLEAIDVPPVRRSKGSSGAGPTLGDIVKVKRKKSQKQE